MSGLPSAPGLAGDFPYFPVPVPGTRLRVLSLRQPWASLVACGAKTLETRSWPAPRALWGQQIAIHAAKGWSVDERAIAQRAPFAQALEGAGASASALPRGVILAVATLHACYSTDRDRDELRRIFADRLHEHTFGNFMPGRYAWRLTHVQPVEPIAARGMLGLWEWYVPLTGLLPLAPARRLERW